MVFVSLPMCLNISSKQFISHETISYQNIFFLCFLKMFLIKQVRPSLCQEFLSVTVDWLCMYDVLPNFKNFNGK